MYEVASASEHVPQVFYNSTWPKNFKKASPAIHLAIKAMFCLMKNPWPFDFITEQNLRTYRLTSVKEPIKPPVAMA